MTQTGHSPAEARALWTEDLRTTDAPQTRGRLHRIDPNYADYAGGERPGWCCLGRACDVFDRHNPGMLRRSVRAGVEIFDGPGDPGHAAGMPEVVREWLGLSHSMGMSNSGRRSLYQLNDEGRSFAEIADEIDAPPPGLLADE